MFNGMIPRHPSNPAPAPEMIPDAALSLRPARFEQARAKQILYGVLSVLWLFPSFGACWILGQSGQPWLRASSLVEGVQAVSLEEWIALALLCAHAVFAWLTLRYRKMVKGAGPSASGRPDEH